MKKWNKIIVIMTSVILIACGYDNYPEPESFLRGKLIYNGEAINVSRGDVTIELWEEGWQKSNVIDVSVNQEGAFSAKLFNSSYKLIIPSSQNPFRIKTDESSFSDTLLVIVKGDTEIDIDVEPYFLIRDVNFSIDDKDITSTFSIQNIIVEEDYSIERVYLYINTGQLVDLQSNVANVSLLADDIADFSSVEMSLTMPELTPTQDYVFGRIGLKILGVEKMIFSKVQEIRF